MNSYKIEVVADSSGEWCGNAIRLVHEQEALDYGKDLAWRWTAVREMRVVPSNDPVNYRWVNGKLEAVS
jgi:hypothetical protein